MLIRFRSYLLTALVPLGLSHVAPVFAQSIVAPVLAQSAAAPGCGSDVLLQNLRGRPDGLMREHAMNAMLRQHIEASHSGERGGDPVLLIPVVVHIIHNNGPENISDATVQLGIQHLNQAFANEGAYAQANGADIGIQFCMAQQDVDGMPTNGITRTVSTLTNMTMETDDAALKNLIRWDPTRYLNIWLVNSITSAATGPGVAGYAYFPTSHGAPEDGIVNEAMFFGSSVDNSKVHIHEAGHYLGLYHTFEGGCVNDDCLSDGDHVCDTPPDGSTQAVSCGNTVNTCNTDDDDASVNNPFRAIALGGLGGQNDLYQDYMDYGLQACQTLYTDGQRERMRAALETQRASLLASPGCSTGCGISIVNLGFAEGSTFVFGSSYLFEPTTLGVNTVTYAWQVNGVTVATTPTFNVDQLPVGDPTVTLILTNTAGGCSVAQTITVHVSCSVPLGLSRYPQHPEPGQPVTFYSDQPQGVTVQWVVDGVMTGSGPTVTQTFSDAGFHNAYVVSNNGGCTDTSIVLGFLVGSCPSAYDRNWVALGAYNISFLTDPPTEHYLTSDPQFYTNEGFSTLSDSYGDITIFSNGMTVWGPNYEMMQNGDSLMGGASSSQAALIVPNPSDNGIHYLFTTDHFAGLLAPPSNGSLRYNVIDMALNGGNGAVTQKNVLLMEPTTEKLAAVKHCNGHDTWVVAHEFGTDAFYSYLITDDGLSTTPLVQHVGKVHVPFTDWGPGYEGYTAIGCMKFSQQGDKLALTSTWGEGFAQVFNFDAETGAITDPITIRNPWDSAFFGVEFSPNGQNLYLTTEAGFVGGSFSSGRVYQCNLAVYDSAAVTQSMSNVAYFLSGYTTPTVVLAPNDKIYVGCNGVYRTIENPDGVGYNCNFQYNNVLGNAVVSLGVNNTVTRNRQAERTSASGPLHVCNYTNGVQYTVDCAHATNNYWIYNGPNTVVSDTYNMFTLDFHVAGMDTLIAVKDNGCEGLFMDTLFIQVGLQLPLLAADTAICAPLAAVLSADDSYATYLWNNGGTADTLAITAPGTYSLTVTGEGGCSLTDQIVVSEFPNTAELSFGPDITICWGSNQTVAAPAGDHTSYLWSTGDTTSSTLLYYVYAPHTVWLQVTDANGCMAVDSLVLIPEYDGPQFYLGPDTTVCEDAVLILGADWLYGTVAAWHWEDGSNLATHTVWQPGTYWATATSPCGYTWTDSITVTLCDFSTTVIEAPGVGDIHLLPNPTTGLLTLNIPGDMDLLTVEVFDMIGNLVLSQQGNARAMDISAMRAGIYAVRLTGNTGQWTGRVVKE